MGAASSPRPSATRAGSAQSSTVGPERILMMFARAGFHRRDSYPARLKVRSGGQVGGVIANRHSRRPPTD